MRKGRASVREVDRGVVHPFPVPFSFPVRQTNPEVVVQLSESPHLLL